MSRTKTQAAIPPKPTNPTYQVMGQQWADSLYAAGYKQGEFFYESAKPTLVQMGLTGQLLEEAAVEVCEAALARWIQIKKG